MSFILGLIFGLAFGFIIGILFSRLLIKKFKNQNGDFSKFYEMMKSVNNKEGD